MAHLTSPAVRCIIGYNLDRHRNQRTVVDPVLLANHAIAGVAKMPPSYDSPASLAGRERLSFALNPACHAAPHACPRRKPARQPDSATDMRPRPQEA